MLSIFNIFKSAAEDIPDWAPEWVKTHSEMDKVQRLSDVEKRIPIENFSDDVNLSNMEEFKNILSKEEKAFQSELQTFLKHLKDKLYSIRVEGIDPLVIGPLRSQIVSRLEDFQYQTESPLVIKEFKTNWQISFIFKSIFDGKEVEKKINLPVGTSINKVLKAFEKIIETYLKTKFDLEITTKNFVSFKDYSFRSKTAQTPYSIVFSTDPQEILGMSSRSSLWSSCQNLIDHRRNQNNEKAVYSALSKYVGIIYLTSNEDYENRGSEMLSRALVFYLEPSDADFQLKAPVVAISHIYGMLPRDKAFDLFFNALSQHSPLPVKSVDECVGDYYLPQDLKNTPYMDSPDLEIYPEEASIVKEHSHQDVLQHQNKKYTNIMSTLEYKLVSSLTNVSMDYTGKRKSILAKLLAELYRKIFNHIKKLTVTKDTNIRSALSLNEFKISLSRKIMHNIERFSESFKYELKNDINRYFHVNIYRNIGSYYEATSSRERKTLDIVTEVMKHLDDDLLSKISNEVERIHEIYQTLLNKNLEKAYAKYYPGSESEFPGSEIEHERDDEP